MDFKKIKQLQSEIFIPLVLAKKMLEENDGDVNKVKEIYHRNNINTICRLAECENKLAEKNYKIYNFDIEKAIKRSYSSIIKLSIGPNEYIDKIGFIFYEENDKPNKYDGLYKKSLFIQTKDFNFVRPVFDSVFPLDFNGESVNFDECGTNFIDNKTGREIVKRLSVFPTKNNNEEQFLRQLVKWFNDKLCYADDIVIFGNL